MSATVTNIRRDTTVDIVRSRQWGDFLVELTVSGTDPLPPKGGAGMGLYTPRKVLLRWSTGDGIEWLFVEAVLVGPKVNHPSMDSAITVYAGDDGQPHCPDWLAGLIDGHAPRKS